MFQRRKVATVAGEFLGTGVLTFTLLDVSRSQIGLTYFYAIAAGLAIALVGLFATDVNLNPAITIALWTARRMKTLQAVAFIAAQSAGAVAAWGLFKYFVGSVQSARTSYEAKTLVAEAVGTFVFALVASVVLYNKVWGVRRSVVVGGAYTLGAWIAMAHSNALLNPAVAWSFHSWGWDYLLGPILGAIIGVNLYGLLFADSESKVARATATVTASAAAATTSSKPVAKPSSKVKAKPVVKKKK